MPKTKLVTSGISPLDAALGGGLREADICQIYGPAGVGKTTLALHFVLGVTRNGNRVLYVNSEGKFPIIRLRQMAATNFTQITPLITIVSPQSFEEQAEFVSKLDSYISQDVRLLVFDTIVSHYRKEYGEDSDMLVLNRKLNQQFGMIASFVKSHPVSVILVNQVRSDINGGNHFLPVANAIASYWSTLCIEITRAESKGYREFKLVKGNQTEPKTFILRLDVSGYKD